MRISDWSSDVCSSDLSPRSTEQQSGRKAKLLWRPRKLERIRRGEGHATDSVAGNGMVRRPSDQTEAGQPVMMDIPAGNRCGVRRGRGLRSEEHTSELQSIMRRSYDVIC